MALQAIFQAIAARLKLSAGPIQDGQQIDLTTDAYGRLIVGSLTSSDHIAADEGSYFIGTMGVAGSGQAIPLGPASAVPSDTAPFFLIMNTATPGKVTSPSLWLKRVYALMSSTQTSELGLDVQCQLDNGVGFYTSGGVKLALNNANPTGPALLAVAYAGTIVKAAKTTNVIYCGRAKIRSTIPVVGDEYIWKSGASEGPSSFLSSSAGASRQVIELGPIVIPPGWTFSMHAAFGATSGGTPTLEIETGHIER